MKRKFYKPFLTVLLSALVSLPGIPALPVQAQTENGTVETVSGGDVGAAGERSRIEDSTFTDAGGNTYKWYGYGDRTAEIYEMVPSAGQVNLTIPSEIEGYTVTSITGNLKGRALETVTIPETITFFGESTFEHAKIKHLYYNAVDASTEESFFYTPFAYAEIDEFVAGDSVETIEGYMFYQTVFKQEELALHIPNIIHYAFHSASFRKLTLTNDMDSLGGGAFTQSKIQHLSYECPDVTLETTDILSGPFYLAEIHKLDVSETMNQIPDYLFANAHFKMDEFTAYWERIGDCAFYDVFDTNGLASGDYTVSKLIITEDVKFIGSEAFAQNSVREVELHANADTNADNELHGAFYMADIYSISIGDEVHRLPDYFFANSHFKFKEYTVTVPEIGDGCFYDVWENNSFDHYPVDLIVSNQVIFIGKNAFAHNVIKSLNYNANAANNATQVTDGLFYMADIMDLTIGDNVTAIPAYLFANADFQKKLDLVLDVPIGDYSFYSVWNSNGGFGSLTIGEHVTAMGKDAFEHRPIDSLTYNAVHAVNANKVTGEAAFWSCAIGSLSIGDTVEVLDSGTFCGIQITQDVLEIPDSVSVMGDYVIFNASWVKQEIFIDTLKIGSGVKQMNPNVFREMTFSTIYMEAVRADEGYNLEIPAADVKYLPKSENLYIHRNSDFYDIFGKNAQTVNLYCDDYMVPSVGEEYYDEAEHRYVTPSYETCSICGYQIMTNGYETALTVVFMANREVIDTKYCKLNGTVTAPEAPELEGYEFIGWDTDFSEVTENLTVTAVYKEIEETENTYTVTFETNGGSSIDPVDVKEGKKVSIPEEPTKEGYGFDGWYLDEELTQPYDWDTEVTENLMLYAKWKDSEGGTEPDPDPAPDLAPDPNPDPDPTPTPDPNPTPTPDPDPTPTPDSDPTPTPDPDPTPTPKPDSTPTPKPTPKQDPTPKPNLETTVTPAPVPAKEPVEDVIIPVKRPAEEAVQPTEKSFPVVPVAVSALVGVSGAGGLGFLFLYRRRKVRGALVNVDGEALDGLTVSLDGRETVTDEKGRFTFRGMARGNHDLCMYDGSGKLVLCLGICANGILTDSGEDEDVFTVRKDSTLNMTAHREGKNYLIDAVIVD